MSEVITRQDLMRILEACGIDHLEVDSNGYLKIDDRYTFNNATLDTLEPVDAKQSNNGLSSGIRYPSTQNILDSNGGILSRVEGVINSNGSIGFNIYANNYNSSGAQIGRAGIQGHVDKNGNVSYGINSPDKFRTALGLGSMATINSPVPIANGGTGQTTAANAFKALSGYTLDLGTNNTTSTWVPVMNSSTIQHRVIPTNILNAGQFAKGYYSFGSVNKQTIKTSGVISFGKTFSATPIVVVGLSSSSEGYGMGNISVSALEITTTGFKARCFNNDTTTPSRSPGIYWIAINI